MASIFLFNVTATTEIYPLSLHDALPIWHDRASQPRRILQFRPRPAKDQRHRYPCILRHSKYRRPTFYRTRQPRSEEHTSELQSHVNLVCRLLLEKKKTNITSRKPTSSTR